jgi:hypothetical protein
LHYYPPLADYRIGFRIASKNWLSMINASFMLYCSSVRYL